MPPPPWQTTPPPTLPPDWVTTVARWAGLGADNPPVLAAQLLWQRGIRSEAALRGFLQPQQYQPTGPDAFGEEMSRAVARLGQARERGEQVAIWGDFDADGVTATSVLWDGLGQFFAQGEQLSYTIPNRLTDSHGLNNAGLEKLAAAGCRLVVTCDTGSTNLAELAYAQELGMEVIVTDHHTLPPDRPLVVAMINPRALPPDHPLAHLSGVAVAYKLVEALYAALPAVPQQPLSDLLDLVAVGLIADLVALKGDCRYLAQVGIEQLKRHRDDPSRRPGLHYLLELCKRNGDRPTDISFGIGPRINAVSRIHGDAHFCVELLTSQDAERCRQLAMDTELANSRRKGLQKDVEHQVEQALAQVDLSTTQVIVLVEAQWPAGILGLVAGQVAQQYGRPAILLTADGEMARGSARSVHGIDLYQLMADQAHLLHRFGGHPFAAGLSLPLENVALLRQAVNRALRSHPLDLTTPAITTDLTVTIDELSREGGKALFRQLSLLEPYGMGNPAPRLLVRNGWFEQVKNRNIQDRQGGKVRYIKTEFVLADETAPQGFQGVWWGHYQDELPPGRCDAVVELDVYNRKYQVRLLAVRPAAALADAQAPAADWLVDHRPPAPADPAPDSLVLSHCPTDWQGLQPWLRRAMETQQPLALAYEAGDRLPPLQVWQQLVGIAKYLSRTGVTASRPQLLEKLQLCDRTLDLGLAALAQTGFTVDRTPNGCQISLTPALPSQSETPVTTQAQAAVEQFLAAIAEIQFRRRYFATAPLAVLSQGMQSG